MLSLLLLPLLLLLLLLLLLFIIIIYLLTNLLVRHCSWIHVYTSNQRSIDLLLQSQTVIYCAKSVRIRSFLVRIFSHLDKYGDILRISRYSVRIRENTDQRNSEYAHFSRSETHLVISQLKEPNTKILLLFNLQNVWISYSDICPFIWSNCLSQT